MEEKFKILVGYDGTDSSKSTIEVVRVHAKAHNAKVFVIKSHKTGTKDESESIDASEKVLDEAKNIFETDNIECETHLIIRGNSPGEDLVEFAEKNKVDLVFVGVKMKSKVGKLIFSSNAQHVVINAPCPVVTVK